MGPEPVRIRHAIYPASARSRTLPDGIPDGGAAGNHVRRPVADSSRSLRVDIFSARDCEDELLRVHTPVTARSLALDLAAGPYRLRGRHVLLATRPPGGWKTVRSTDRASPRVRW